MLLLVLFSWLGLGNSVVSEPVLGLSDGDFLVGHSSASLSFSLGSLLGPVVSSHLLIGESASRASLVLDVVALVAASSALAMNLGVSLSHSLSSLSLDHRL